MGISSLFSDNEKRGFVITVSILFVICAGLLVWLMYYYLFLNGQITISTAYLDKASYSDETKFFMEINYYSNEKGNGEEVFEIKLNYYTDTRIPEIEEDGQYGTKYMYSTGAQFIGGVEYSWNKGVSIVNLFSGKQDHKYTLLDGYYYDTEMGGTSFTSLKNEKLVDQDKWIYDINGELCLIQPIKLNHDVVDYWDLWVAHVTNRDISYFILQIYNTVKSLDEGENIFALNLSEYFFVTLQNENGSFDSEPTDDVNYLYSNIKVNVNSNGMISSDQSIFGIVEENSNWSLYGENSENYWQVKVEHNLTANDFNVIFKDGAYYLKMKTECEEYLKTFNYLNLIITLDLDNIQVETVNVDVIGFDESLYNAFDVYKLILNSTTERTFNVLDDDIIIEADDVITINTNEEVLYA